MARSPADPQAPAVASAYFTYFAALGFSGPFLASYFASRGFAPPDVAYLLALLPFVRLLATPAWTLLADRLRSTSVVARLVTLGALLWFAALALPVPRVAVVVILIGFTAFRSPITSLFDTMALQWSSRTGGDFGRLRVWGTLGYTAATFVAGGVIARFGAGSIVPIGVVLMALTVVVTMRLPGSLPVERVHLWGSLRLLLVRPRFVLFLLTAALQQIGMSIYDGLYAAHVSGDIGMTMAGVAVAIGTTAEALFMTWGRRIVTRLGYGRMLVVAYAATAVRWGVLAYTHHVAVILGLQVLHALSFGAFYVAAVGLVDEESPPAVRASGQGVFSAAIDGLASAAGLALAGRLERHGGFTTVLMVSALASGLAAVLALALGRPPARE